jgi:hypothetical protein|tara:strand:- start:246 stop:497 length:252 start_codon:yes stop_codon:yes gene_type:complete
MKKLNSFYTIFKDSNDWNEKSIVGFSSFVIMVLFAIADLVTGYFGKDLVINDYIYNSFLWIVLGSFSIDSAQKVFASGKKSDK